MRRRENFRRHKSRKLGQLRQFKLFVFRFNFELSLFLLLFFLSSVGKNAADDDDVASVSLMFDLITSSLMRSLRIAKILDEDEDDTLQIFCAADAAMFLIFEVRRRRCSSFPFESLKASILSFILVLRTNRRWPSLL